MNRGYHLLTNAGVSATLRLEKGHDTCAASGKFRLLGKISGRRPKG
jgi:hypothetical protein